MKSCWCYWSSCHELGYFGVMQSCNMRKNLKLAFFLLSKRWEPVPSLPATGRMIHLQKWQKNRKFPPQISNFSPQKHGAFCSIPDPNSSSDWKRNTERYTEGMSQSPNAALVYLPVYHESANTNCHPDPEQLSNYNFVIINYWVENHL